MLPVPTVSFSYECRSRVSRPGESREDRPERSRGAPDRNGRPGVESARDELNRAEREALRRREPAALERFYDLYFDRIYGYVRRLLRDDHLAEDTTQDVFMQLLRAFDTYDAARPLRPWVFRIATHRVRDLWQSRAYRDSPRARAVEPDGLAPPPSEERTPLESLEASERRAELDAAIEAVPETLRATLCLRAFHELSFAEIADLFDQSEVAIRKRYSRALGHLRSILVGEPDARIAPERSGPERAGEERS